MNEYVSYADKESNPPNVTKAQAIENFWEHLPIKVYKGGWQALNEQILMIVSN